VLVAAGIAVYENPQVRLWVDNSRRKIAIALHSLGDEINPASRTPEREDISMTEATGEEAEERRRKAKEDLLRRRRLMEERRRKMTTSSAGSFDALVDDEGRLKDSTSIGKLDPEETHASTTAVEATEGNLTRRNLDTSHAASDFSAADGLPPMSARELLRGINGDRLHISLPSEISSNHPSESLVDLTPTSEFPDTQPASPTSHTSESRHDQQDNMGQSEYFSMADSASSSTDEYYYSHPQNPAQNNPSSNQEQLSSPFADPLTRENLHDVSSAPSIAGSLSHIQNETGDTSSDGTVSDLGYPADGIQTPASWSEVGSVISSNDGSHN
jgi:hypothetical protein